MVPFESMLEADYLLQRDAFDFDLKLAIAQPLSVDYFYGGKWRKWTPDFQIWSGESARHELVEVKTWSHLYPDDEQRRLWLHGKFNAIAEHTERLAVRTLHRSAITFKFVLCTDKEIRIQPRLYNAGLMSGAVSQRQPPDAFEAELAVLSLPHRTTVRDLQRVLGSGHDAFSLALYLAWRGVIRLDPSEKWSRETPLVRTSRRLS